MPQQIVSWFDELNSQQRLKFACLTMFMGEERVAEALVDCADIDELFANVACKVYGAN